MFVQKLISKSIFFNARSNLNGLGLSCGRVIALRHPGNVDYVVGWQGGLNFPPHVPCIIMFTDVSESSKIIRSGAHYPEPPSPILILGVNPVPFHFIFRTPRGSQIPANSLECPIRTKLLLYVTRRWSQLTAIIMAESSGDSESSDCYDFSSDRFSTS